MISKEASCARCGYETVRIYVEALGGIWPQWERTSLESRMGLEELATEILRGELPIVYEEHQRQILFMGSVRCMAAALGMAITYPAVPARNGMPAFPKRTIDWSKSPPVDRDEL